MEDMNLMAKLFVASSKLRLASSLLEALSNGDEVNDNEEATLKWVGNFLCQLDWNSSQFQNNQISSGQGIQATSIRPAFYSSIIRIAPQLKEIQIDSEEKLVRFLHEFYSYLLSDKEEKLKNKLKSDYSKIGSNLLSEIAQTIFIQLNNNGLPKIAVSLNDTWKPSSNEFSFQVSASV